MAQSKYRWRGVWAALVFAALVAPPQAWGAATQVGPGGGGFLYSGAFHPSNADVFLIGGDNCGVYRSDTYGPSASFYLWNQGLTNIDLAESDYIEDLLGVTWDGGTRTGFFAATRAGVYWRDAASTAAPWALLTPANNFNYDSGTKPLPFSCLASDGSTLVAGAGYARFPGDESGNEPPKDASLGTQNTVWLTSLTGTPAPNTWFAVPGSAFTSVRNISVATPSCGTRIVVATPSGVHVYGGTWTQVYTGDDCWSVHLTPRGTLYAAFETGAVRRIANLCSGSSWETVDKATPGTTTGPPPTCRDVSNIGDLALLSVINGQGSDPDQLFLTGTPDGTDENGGLFRCALVGTQAIPSDLLWKHWAYDYHTFGPFVHNFKYTEAAGTDPYGCGAPLQIEYGTEQPLDPGYLTQEFAWSRHHPIVTTAAGGVRAVLQLEGRLHLYDGVNDEWRQVYTSAHAEDDGETECELATFYQSTGYRQLTIRDFAFALTPSRVLAVDADNGLFKSNPANRDEFKRQNPELSSLGAYHVEYDAFSGAVYVVYGDPDQDGHLYRWTPGDCDWFEQLAAPGLRLGAILLQSSDVLYIVGQGVGNGFLLRGTPSGNGWSWQMESTGAASINVAYTRLLYNSHVGYVFLCAQNGLYARDAAAASGTPWVPVLTAGTRPGYVDFRAIAASQDGQAMYVGTAGRVSDQKGGVFQWVEGQQSGNGTDPDDWALITDRGVTGTTFGFAVPLLQSSWSETQADEYLTEVWSLAVDPFDNESVFAGLFSGIGSFEQEGLWVYRHWDSTGWERFPTEPVQGTGIFALGFNGSGSTSRTLWVGTAGVEMYRVGVTKQPTGGGGDPGCPYVFVASDGRWAQENTILRRVAASAAGSAAANARDAYVLTHTPTPMDGAYHLEVREFEHEHSFIDHVALVGVTHPEDTDIVATNTGELLARSPAIRPLSARLETGEDVLAAVLHADGNTLHGAPGTVVELLYPPLGAERIALVMDTDPKDPEEPNGKVSGIEIQVQNEEGEFEHAGLIEPREFMAPRALLLAAQRSPDAALRVRLVWHTAHDLDFAGLTVPVTSGVDQHILPLCSARGQAKYDVRPMLEASDGSFVELRPGDTLTLAFDATVSADSYALFVDGHYYKLEAAPVPRVFRVGAATPNPFNPATQVRFTMPGRGRVTATIYATNGTRVCTLLNAETDPGEHELTWNGLDEHGHNVRSGVYHLKLETTYGTETRKLTLLK